MNWGRSGDGDSVQEIRDEWRSEEETGDMGMEAQPYGEVNWNEILVEMDMLRLLELQVWLLYPTYEYDASPRSIQF